MTEVGYKDGRSNIKIRGLIEDICDVDPNVFVEGGGVVEPGSAIAEFLGELGESHGIWTWGDSD